MDNWVNMINKTREFILSDFPSIKAFHAINLRALAEMKKLSSSPGKVIEEIDRGTEDMNAYLNILHSSSDKEELNAAANSIADLLTRRPMVLRWVLVELIRSGEFERAEALVCEVKVLVKKELDRRRKGEEDFWGKLEATYSDELVIAADLELHLRLLVETEKRRK